MTRPDLRRWPWRIALGLALAVAAALAWRAVRGTEVPAALVTRGDMVQRVVASGRVLAPARIQVGSVVLGRVTRVAVDKGDRVKAGQVLVRLDGDEARAALAQARGALAQAEARLEQVAEVSGKVSREALEQARIRLDQAEVRLRRQRTLAEAGSVSQADLDDATRAWELARSQLESAQVQAAAVAARGTDRRVAEAALAQARGAEAAAAVRLEQTEIRSPDPGVVVERSVEPGDVVQPGRTLLVVARDGPTQLSAQPDEKNLALLALGQPALASADAFPDRTFPARVAYLAPSVDLARGTVEVKLDVADPPPFLRPDMTVSVNVEAARAAGALRLPADAIRDAGTASPWVLVIRGGRATRQDVKLGLRGEGWVQILSGVSEGEAVVLPGARIQPGARVRPRAA